MLRISIFTRGTNDGTTLNSATPRPINNGTMDSSPAISPQTPVHIFCAWPESTVVLISRRIPGCGLVEVGDFFVQPIHR